MRVCVSSQRACVRPATDACGHAHSGELFVQALAERVFAGNLEQAGMRLLKDFRQGKLGNWALEVPIS